MSPNGDVGEMGELASGDVDVGDELPLRMAIFL